MKINRIFTACLLGLLALGAQSCLKSYVEYFDTSSSERITAYLSDLDKMLGGEQYGWRMEYYVGNEDGDFGGINLALKFDAEKGEVTAMSEENATEAYTSHYVLTTDSGPVLSFDTHNKILHKYGTASSDYYEGRGGDYQFFVVGYDKEKKVINLKGKRNGKFCTMYPLSEPIETFNAKMNKYKRNFYVSSFTGDIDGQKVTGEIDVNNHQFTANEMEEYEDDRGRIKIDIKEGKVRVTYTVQDYDILKVEDGGWFGSIGSDKEDNNRRNQTSYSDGKRLKNDNTDRRLYDEQWEIVKHYPFVPKDAQKRTCSKALVMTHAYSNAIMDKVEEAVKNGITGADDDDW